MHSSVTLNVSQVPKEHMSTCDLSIPKDKELCWGQHYNLLAAKLNTNLSSTHRTCMDGKRKTNSRQLLRPPALMSNKNFFKEKKVLP